MPYTRPPELEELKKMDVRDMTRALVLRELSAYARHEHFEQMLKWPDHYLKGILTFYREGGDFGAIPVGVHISIVSVSAEIR